MGVTVSNTGSMSGDEVRWAGDIIKSLETSAEFIEGKLKEDVDQMPLSVSSLQVVQVYISWQSVSFAPIRQLVGVERTAIEAGKQMTVSLV